LRGTINPVLRQLVKSVQVERDTSSQKREDGEWHVIYVMPNLAPAPGSWQENLTDPNTHANLFWTGVSLDCETVAIVSMHDARVQSAASRDPNVGKLLATFVDTSGKPLHPSVLIVRDRSAFTKEQEGLVAFRNCVAISVILHTRASWARGYDHLGGGWSDHFDFHPLQLGAHGLISASAAQLAIFSEGAKYKAMPSPYISATTVNTLFPDKFLRHTLTQEWRRTMSVRRDAGSLVALYFDLLKLRTSRALHPSNTEGRSMSSASN
jgi:hypothetical protein